MPAPTNFNLPVLGSAPNQYATEQGLEQELQRVFDLFWDGKADVPNSGKLFNSRAAAEAAGQATLPAALGTIYTVENGDLVVRSAGQVADDPLFATAPRWGVAFRFHRGATFAGDFGGTAGALTLTIPAFVNLAGQSFVARLAGIDSGEAPTLAVNGGAALPIQNALGSPIKTGEIVRGQYHQFTRIGTGWRVMSWAAAGLRSYRATSPASANGLAYTATLADGAVADAATLIEIAFPVANAGAASLAINGAAALPIQDRLGRALSAGTIAAGSNHLLFPSAGRFLALTIAGGDPKVEALALAQAAGRQAAASDHPLDEAGRETESLTLSGDAGAFSYWTASRYDSKRLIVCAGARRVDLRHMAIGPADPISIWLFPGSSPSKLITDGKVYTATGGTAGAMVKVWRPTQSAYVFEGPVSEGPDALDPPAACDWSFITGGQSLAQRFLRGAGMAGFLRGLSDHGNMRPAVWAINGATGGSGLVPQSNAAQYWWDPSNDTPGPAALTWKAALDGRPSTQPAPRFVYWCLGQTDAQQMGGHANLSFAAYKATYKKLFAWMREQIGNPNCPIIISPLGAWDSHLTLTDKKATAVRMVEVDVAAEVGGVHIGPMYYDLPRPFDDVHLELAGQMLQGHRLAAHAVNIINANTAVRTGPWVSDVIEADAGKRYRILIRDTTPGGIVYPPDGIDMLAVLPAGADPLTADPLPIERMSWAPTAGAWFLDVHLYAPSLGAKVVYPYGALVEARAERFPRSAAPTGYGNYWPLRPVMRGAP